MKTRLSISAILLIIVLTITGCKAAATQSVDSAMDSAYPAGKDYPIEDLIVQSGEEAYPITQQNLGSLYRTWALSTYKVNDQEQTPPMKTLTFQMDGVVEMTGETGKIEGRWFADISMYPILTLEMNDGTTLTYSLIALTESNLDLQLIQDGNVIDESYQPAG